MKWMRSCFCLTVALCASVASISTVALADGPDAMSQGCQSVGHSAGNYNGTRHSKLSQITVDNAAKLKVAWTMSTGTLRGQEGQPLVIGNMMYFESSYPNFVYAVDLDNIGQMVGNSLPSRTSLRPRWPAAMW